jgi:hypothetical protein
MKNLARMFALLALISILSTCAVIQNSTTAKTVTPDSPSLNTESADFLLTKGTSWIYSYDEYKPTQTDPTKVTSATYQFTETVVDTESTTKYFVAHIHRDEQFVKADPDWVLTESSRPKEYWYLVSGQQIFESFKQPNTTFNRIHSYWYLISRSR